MPARFKGDDIADRLLELAVGVMDEADQLVAMLTTSANAARRRADQSAQAFPVGIPCC